MYTWDRQQLISGDSVHPSLPQEYSVSWEEEMISDYSFAAAAYALLEEGRVDDALQLTRRGVAAHSLYVAGHIVLARVLIAQKSWEAACEPLERALQLDGPTPALLEMLAMCYDETGQIDLALECRSLGRDHDMRPLTEEEHEEGPEMVDERADDLEPGDEIVEQPDEPGTDIIQELDVPEDPKDALKELEALLDGVGSSITDNQDGNDLKEIPVESEELETTDVGADEAGSKDDMWKTIMEQADTLEQTGYSGAEDIESLVSDSETETGAEPASEPESEAVPVELTSDLEPAQPEKEEPVEATAVAPDLELEETLLVEDTGNEEQEVSPAEDLDTGSSGVAMEDLPYSAASEGEGELPGEEKGIVIEPVELSEEPVKEAEEGLELDSWFDEDKPEEAATDEAAADTTELSSDVEAALQALESDLEMQSDVAAPTEQPGSVVLEDDSVGLETTALDEIAMDITEAAGEEVLPFASGKESVEVQTEGGLVQINNDEDSIKLAIQAEILVAKGHTDGAIRLLEALLLWEPDRASYKKRLEELRRLQE